jgi:hypothetical protein
VSHRNSDGAPLAICSSSSGNGFIAPIVHSAGFSGGVHSATASSFSESQLSSELTLPDLHIEIEVNQVISKSPLEWYTIYCAGSFGFLNQASP